MKLYQYVKTLYQLLNLKLFKEKELLGYVFLSNSTKPTDTEQNSRTPIQLTNVSRPSLQIALEMGFDVHLGINRENPESLECELPIHLYDGHTYRSVFAFKDNIIAFRNLAKVLKKNNIYAIHCNTPVGGLIGRLAGRIYKIPKVIYTAHGFHFYKGAPLFNRTVLKLAELIMARWTDAIITMNEEDFQAASKFKLRKRGKVFKVSGVGITLADFETSLADFETSSNNRDKLRKSLGLSPNDIAFISAGDLIPRKNYKIAIEAIAKTNNPNVHYYICGEGPELTKLKQLTSKLKIEQQIHFLGRRTDIKDLFHSMDGFLFTTLQEGMPRSMMEAMACGLPCIASNIRGNKDLLVHGKGGFLCEPLDIMEFAYRINSLTESSELRQKMKVFNLLWIKKYDVSVVKKELDAIYKEVLLPFI